MKNFAKSAILFALLFAATNVSAQTDASVWTVDAIKTNDGEQANALRFFEKNWAAARQILKQKGDIKSYRILSVKPEKSQPWDVMLLTEYANRAAFDKREAIFAEVFKNLPTVLINGKAGRDMSKIVNADSGYDEAASSAKIAEMSDKTEREAVKIPLENYIKAQATGSGDLIRQAFHKDARIMAFRDGKLLNLSVEEFASRFTGKAADDEAQRKRSFEIIEIAGNAAVARIELDYPTVKFVDYMSLLKVDGEWKIVNKSFYAEPKGQPKKQ